MLFPILSGYIVLVVVDLVPECEALFQKLPAAFGVDADALGIGRRRVVLKDTGHVGQQFCGGEQKDRIAILICTVK